MIVFRHENWLKCRRHVGIWELTLRIIMEIWVWTCIIPPSNVKQKRVNHEKCWLQISDDHYQFCDFVYAIFSNHYRIKYATKQLGPQLMKRWNTIPGSRMGVQDQDGSSIIEKWSPRIPATQNMFVSCFSALTGDALLVIIGICWICTRWWPQSKVGFKAIATKWLFTLYLS